MIDLSEGCSSDVRSGRGASGEPEILWSGLRKRERSASFLGNSMGLWKEGLLLLLVCLGLVLSVESGRAHERFSQTTYYANPNSLEPEIPDDSAYTSPVKEESKVPGKESKEESTKDFFPAEVNHSEHEGTFASGDFTADARPWWVNPEYQNYGSSPLKKPSTDPSSSTLDPRYFNNYQHSRGTFNQYVENQNQGPGSYARNSRMDNGYDDVPFEPSGGGCPTDYWISSTQRWPSFFNTKSTVGDAFGTPAAQIYGKTTILQALLDTHADGYHSLARNGCTAILNAYTRQQYKFSHQKVIESFNAALISNKAAARQAALFDEANLSALSQQDNSCV